MRENLERRWRYHSILRRNRQEPQQSNDQRLSQSYKVFRSQRSQCIFTFCLLSIPYDLRILFFSMGLSFLEKEKEKKKDSPHSFLLKKKKNKKTAQSRKSQTYSVLFSLWSLHFWLKATTSFPAATILSHWINDRAESASCYGACEQVNWPLALPFSLQGERKQNDGPMGSFRATKLVQWTTARRASRVWTPQRQGPHLWNPSAWHGNSCPLFMERPRPSPGGISYISTLPWPVGSFATSAGAPLCLLPSPSAQARTRLAEWESHGSVFVWCCF